VPALLVVKDLRATVVSAVSCAWYLRWWQHKKTLRDSGDRAGIRRQTLWQKVRFLNHTAAAI